MGATKEEVQDLNVKGQTANAEGRVRFRAVRFVFPSKRRRETTSGKVKMIHR